MSEPTDAVMPILRRIQADISVSRRDLGRKIDVNTGTLASHGDRLESIENYLTYELGLTARAKADINFFKTELKAIKRRVAALERSSPKRRPK
jgi:hypothetical protein